MDFIFQSMYKSSSLIHVHVLIHVIGKKIVCELGSLKKGYLYFKGESLYF